MRALVLGGLLLAGCGPEELDDASDVTWHEDVAPIVQQRCVGCHSEGQIAPFALQTYEQAREWAPLIAAAVETRTMPPWGVDSSGQCQTFSEPAWLSDQEISRISKWADSGAGEGEGNGRIEVPPRAEIAQPDAVLDIGLDYEPELTPDDYRCFIVDPASDVDRFLTAFEVAPGNREIVHHVILYTLDTPQAESLALDLEARDGKPGYTCFGSSVVPDSRPIAAWAPGTPVTTIPGESGIRLVGGQKLVIQVHYNTAETSGTDRTRIRMELADHVPKEALVLLLADLEMELPPGEDHTPWELEFDLAGLNLPLGVYLRGVFPHMHRRGRSMRLELVREQGTECLMDVPRWDFDWQQMYWYEQPVYVFANDTVRLSCTYDMSHDTEPVSWGDGTDDEMCLVGLVATVSL